MAALDEITLRPPAVDELKEFMQLCEAAFGWEFKEDDLPRYERTVEPERFLFAQDGDAKVGTAGAFSFRLSVPGGEVPAAGVTVVGVLPSHRRRGLLTRMMRHQLDDIRERGEPVAILWATEAPIYGRFGYGLASTSVRIETERDRARFRGDPEPVGRTRIVTLAQALELLPEVYERIRPSTPGMVTRSRAWWEAFSLADPEHERDGAGPLFCAVLELDGQIEAYALYRLKLDWEDGISKSKLTTREVVASSPVATREIWRFLFGVDLVDRILSYNQPADTPLLLMLADPRRLRATTGDALWLRLVDVEAALSARSYAAEGSVTFDLADELCPWNEGIWRLDAGERGAALTKTTSPPELRLETADLASTYLGGFSFAELAAAGRVEELADGVLERADRLFRTPRQP